jgi:hypothetical protein
LHAFIVAIFNQISNQNVRLIIAISGWVLAYCYFTFAQQDNKVIIYGNHYINKYISRTLLLIYLITIKDWKLFHIHQILACIKVKIPNDCKCWIIQIALWIAHLRKYIFIVLQVPSTNQNVSLESHKLGRSYHNKGGGTLWWVLAYCYFTFAQQDNKASIYGNHYINKYLPQTKMSVWMELCMSSFHTVELNTIMQASQYSPYAIPERNITLNSDFFHVFWL